MLFVGLKYSSSWEVTEILSTALAGALCRSSKDLSETPKFVTIYKELQVSPQLVFPLWWQGKASGQGCCEALQWPQARKEISSLWLPSRDGVVLAQLATGVKPTDHKFSFGENIRGSLAQGKRGHRIKEKRWSWASLHWQPLLDQASGCVCLKGERKNKLLKS